jgi:hypothetical protein
MRIDVMLGIDVRVNMKKVQFPIYFDYEMNNTCTHCGATGTVRMVDKFGRVTKEEVHPFDHLQCAKCGQKYTIRWVDEENGKHPYTSDPSIARQFTNFIGHKLDNLFGK